MSAAASATWLLLGGGYCAGALAAQLVAEGAPVVSVTRSGSALVAQGVDRAPDGGVRERVIAHDLLEGPCGVPVRCGVAVISAPPTPDDDERRLERHAVATAVAAGVDLIVYWSSTGVLGESGGAVVDDETPPAPTTSLARRRRAAELAVEDAAAAAGVPCCVMRLVGIYGEGRTIRSRIEAGTYRYVDDGGMWTNRIFRDDVGHATRFIAALGPDRAAGAWVVSDGAPFRVIEMVRFIVAETGAAQPPSVALDELPERARSFWIGDRRVRPARLLAAGWRPTMPTFREGLPEAWRRELDGASQSASGGTPGVAGARQPARRA